MMRRVLVLASFLAGAATAQEAPVAGDEVRFDAVQSIFLNRCIRCHVEGSLPMPTPRRLRLNSLAAILAGGDSVVVLPGNAQMSAIWRYVAGVQSPQMPADGPPFLSDEEIALIAAWIDGGARDAAGEPAPMPVGGIVRLVGELTAPDAFEGRTFLIDDATEIEGSPVPGFEVELFARIGEDGELTATRLVER